MQLACLMQQDTNCIIMDEPTNHIDIDTREVLEEALQDYKGTFIAVTHDRYLANKLAQRIIEIEDGVAISYLGNYDDYRSRKKTEKTESDKKQTRKNDKKEETTTLEKKTVKGKKKKKVAEMMKN